MDITIRQEEQRDYPAVYNLIKAAFANMQESDHKEHLLVERLRRSGAFVPELSLIAETRDGKVIGYILLTEVEIASPEKKVLSLGLAPVAVLPEYQNRGDRKRFDKRGPQSRRSSRLSLGRLTRA